MHIRNILVGYDESAPARRALALAEDIAAQYDARIVLVSVLQPINAPPVQVMYPTEEEISKARRVVEVEAARMQAEGKRVEAFVEIGVPARALLDLAQKLEVDVTIVGRSGKGAVARAIMGSVTTSLLHTTTKPIIVVP
jgi:nucleotide-binding universal stress UspA family protein